MENWGTTLRLALVAQPTPVPSLVPSPLPTLQPTLPRFRRPRSCRSLRRLLPIPSPSQEPIPAPTTMPIPAPTPVPAPAPTKVPIPSPTTVPIPAPTTLRCPHQQGAHPVTHAAAHSGAHATPCRCRPVIQFLADEPAHSIALAAAILSAHSRADGNAHAAPSSRPSPSPTPKDTVAVVVALQVTTPSEASLNLDVFRPSLASVLQGIEEAMIKSLEVAITDTSRRRRHLLSMDAEVQVGLSASLSGLGYATASELVASVMSDQRAAADGTRERPRG